VAFNRNHKCWQFFKQKEAIQVRGGSDHRLTLKVFLKKIIGKKDDDKSNGKIWDFSEKIS